MEANVSASGSAEIGRDDEILGKTKEEQEKGFKSAASSEGVGVGLDALARHALEQVRAGRFNVVQLGEDFEDAARYVPLAGQAVELRRKLFDAANSLGIRKELDLLYHSAATGQKVGIALGQQAFKMAGQWGVSAQLAPLLSVAAGPIGVASAIGFGLATLFSSKSEERAKESARVQAFVAGLDRIVKRRSLDEMIDDQDTILANTEALLADFPFPAQFRPVAEAARNAAKSLGVFYRVAKGTMNANEIAALESSANVARWKAARDAVKANRNVLMVAIGRPVWRALNQAIATEEGSGVYQGVIAPIMNIGDKPASRSGLAWWIAGGTVVVGSVVYKLIRG